MKSTRDKTDAMIRYYSESHDESKRLTDGFGRLERARTEELLARFLPKPRQGDFFVRSVD